MTRTIVTMAALAVMMPASLAYSPCQSQASTSQTDNATAPVLERGFASQLWQRFYAGENPVPESQSAGAAKVPPDALLNRGLTPAGHQLSAERITFIQLPTTAAASTDTQSQGAPVGTGVDDWQAAAMQSARRGGSAVTGGGPSLTTCVVGFAALIVLVGTFLMPR